MRNRRQFLHATAATLAAGLAVSPGRAEGGKLHVATNVYPWYTFYRREGRDFEKDLDTSLAEVAKSGMDGFEPIGSSPQQIQALGQRLQQHKLQMRSLYVNSKLHDPKEAAASIRQALAIADAAKALDCRIIVTNPSPIRWGGLEDKTDEQIRFQAERLTELGTELKKRGLTLAYHNHDIELRNAAREFLHMLAGTDPEAVRFCLDAHWVYRGSGDSQVFLFDVVKLHGKRVVELHLRQSDKGVWTEAFGPGDIDYGRLVKMLLELGVKPHVVLEQAVEAKSPKTMGAVEAHSRGSKTARELFAPFA